MLGKIHRLKVVIVRTQERGRLRAYVEQQAADGLVRGSDLLKAQRIIHLESAKHYIQWMMLSGVEIEWVVEEGANQMEDQLPPAPAERDPYAAPAVKHDPNRDIEDDDDVPF